MRPGLANSKSLQDNPLRNNPFCRQPTLRPRTRNQLAEGDLESVQLIDGDGHPMVYGEWLGAPRKPTILCYGHYDVQPSDPDNAWESEPFEPTVRDG